MARKEAVDTRFDELADDYMRGLKKHMQENGQKLVRQWKATTPTEGMHPGAVNVLVWDPSKKLREVCFTVEQADPLAKYHGKMDLHVCTKQGSDDIPSGNVRGGKLAWVLDKPRELQITTAPSGLKVVITLYQPADR